MATYQQLVAQGMSPNQAALQAQLGASGGTPTAVQPQHTLQPAVGPAPTGRMGNQPLGPPPAAPQGAPNPLGPAGPGFSSPSNTQTAPAGTGPAPAGGAGGGGLGPFALEGYDAGKLGSGHDTPKYQIGRTISQFDPSKGITPEVIAALNQLGIGTFDAVGNDKVRVSGNADPRFEGTTTFDLVRGMNGPGGGQAWQFGVVDAPGAEGGAGGAPMAMGGGMVPASNPGLDALLSGDPLQKIQQAISQINGNGQVNLNALLAQLQGV